MIYTVNNFAGLCIYQCGRLIEFECHFNDRHQIFTIGDVIFKFSLERQLNFNFANEICVVDSLSAIYDRRRSSKKNLIVLNGSLFLTLSNIVGLEFLITKARVTHFFGLNGRSRMGLNNINRPLG